MAARSAPERVANRRCAADQALADDGAGTKLEKFRVRGDGATKATSSEVDALSVPVITARATGTGGTAGFTNTVLRVETVKTGADGTGDVF